MKNYANKYVKEIIENVFYAETEMKIENYKHITQIMIKQTMTKRIFVLSAFLVTSRQILIATIGVTSYQH